MPVEKRTWIYRALLITAGVLGSMGIASLSYSLYLEHVTYGDVEDPVVLFAAAGPIGYTYYAGITLLMVAIVVGSVGWYLRHRRGTTSDPG